MVKSVLDSPLPTREAGQRSSNQTSAFFTRFTPAWQRPSEWSANAWRHWVMSQPVAVICRETLIASLLALDWKITPREMKYKDELSGTIKHYTKLLESGGNNPELSLDYSSLTEWVAGDLLDTPFGGVAEVGRKGDTENGRVVWFKPLDAATMYPTLNKDFPVVQYWAGYEAVSFPSYAITRTYLSPIPHMDRQGWGVPPPEKVFFALNLLNRGDKYYANLLLDIPTAGILDLGDMERSSAEDWVESFRTFMNEADTALRIPVLYEHNNPVQYIPFGKVPNDIMFDNITTKYAAIVASAYGVTLGDIGLEGGGSDTLAGSIRSERKTRKTGFARVKAKMKYFFDQILPDTLQFNFVDYDDELNVAMGRARLATSTAFKNMVDLKMFSPQELRSQAIADGLVSITLPDDVPDESEFPKPEPVANQFGNKPTVPTKRGKVPKEPEVVGNPKPPSSGGEGEFNARSLTTSEKSTVISKAISVIPTLSEYFSSYSEDDFHVAKSVLRESDAVSKYLSDMIMTSTPVGSDSESTLAFTKAYSTAFDVILAEIEKAIFDNGFELDYDSLVETLNSTIN